ncbi:sugar transferase [Pontibacter litorisediminis]|uniref:sugar transferase n=1 Tax=Pontibacter litorisediminis TaxID=1846260 RepID=UPI0023EB69CB|nr:sugar transferase [Pontibacter litorisediminis]
MSITATKLKETNYPSNPLYFRLLAYLVDKRVFSFEVSDRKYLLYTVDLLLVLSAAFLYGTRAVPDLAIQQMTTAHYWYFVPIVVFWSFFSYVFDLYNLEKINNFYTTVKYVFIASTLTVASYVLFPWFTPPLPSRFTIILFYFTLLSPLAIWRYIYSRLLDSPLFLKRVLIVGSSWSSNALIDVFANGDIFNYHLGYKIVGVIDEDSSNTIYKGVRIINGTSNITKLAKRLKIDEIIVDETKNKDNNEVSIRELTNCRKAGIAVTTLPDFYEYLTGRVLVHNTARDFSLAFPYNRNQYKTAYLFFSRALDVAFGVCGVLLCLLFMPLVYIANLLGSKGPLFYSQERVGLYGKTFKIVKFRSMVVDAEKDGAAWAQKNDSRITEVGKILRRSRIDELPQAWSVLKGDMSLIGPRPERPVFVEQLKNEIPFYDTRHLTKPGITGWAQAIYKYGSNSDDALMKVQYDLYYLKNRSFMMDIKVLLKTISVVVRFKGM